MIPVFEPTLNKYAKKNIEKCLKTNWISSQGLFVKKLEKKISNFHKSKYCIVTSSCTSALHLALLSCGIKENDIDFNSIKNHDILMGGNKISKLDILFKKINKDD